MKKIWWKEAVVYQIYPRSFKDSNRDGIGDLRGIIEKVDYIKQLGIDVIWLNPVYKSPNDDNGYDISDYYNIMEEFGTIEDLEELLKRLHENGIKLIMDLVVNHTSDEHEWFIKSKESKKSLYRDYYIWRKEKNNWHSFFGGSAWEYDSTTEEYYLHIFSKKQPDLNWENENLRKDIYKMMKFWLDKGIDGFRMDVINFISKYPGLPDDIEKEGYVSGSRYIINGPKAHEYLKEMNKEVLRKYDIFTVGETPEITPEDGVKFTHPDSEELNMIFQFDLFGIDIEGSKWNNIGFNLEKVKSTIGKWQKVIEEGGWITNFLMNHDSPRAVSRFGDDEKYREESAKMLAIFNLSLPGTSFIYQGEEIGMTNPYFDSIEDYRDIETLNYYNEAIKKMDEKTVIEKIKIMSRDNARTPMQWDNSKNAGFTEGIPWIKVNENYKNINVKQALEDKNSIFYFYKNMIKIRKEHKDLIYGRYIPLEYDKIYAYRIKGENEYLIILNWKKEEEIIDMDFSEYRLLIGNYDNKTKILKPYEGRLYQKI